MRRPWFRLAAFGLALGLAVTVPSRADEEEIAFADCPAAVKKTLEAELKGERVDTVNKEIEDGKTTYWTDFDRAGKHYNIGVSEGGRLVEISLDVDTDDMGFADAPAAVQKAFREESKGATIGTVNKDLRYGREVYKAVVPIGGKDYEIVIADDGTLVEKTLSIEEEERALSDCPAAVQKTLRAEAGGAPIDAVTRSSGIGGAVYEVTVEIGGKSYTIEVAEDGSLIAKSVEDDD